MAWNISQTMMHGLRSRQKKRSGPCTKSRKSCWMTFLERNAISKAQYDKSLHDMTEKMGYGETK